jgi:chromosome segregation ATPase
MSEQQPDLIKRAYEAWKNRITQPNLQNEWDGFRAGWKALEAENARLKAEIERQSDHYASCLAAAALDATDTDYDRFKRDHPDMLKLAEEHLEETERLWEQIATIKEKSVRRHRALRELNRAIIVTSQALQLAVNNGIKLGNERQEWYEKFVALEAENARLKARAERAEAVVEALRLAFSASICMFREPMPIHVYEVPGPEWDRVILRVADVDSLDAYEKGK